MIDYCLEVGRLRAVDFSFNGPKIFPAARGYGIRKKTFGQENT